ncbi:MAG: hypothetical protein QOH71_2289 [Blastocatellia bacterium]|jgi:hypothetical protein|nr:hypothetical protein [Blastocatellia bacterium]
MGSVPGAIEVVSKLRMCDLKEDLNAEDAKVFAKARREVPYFAYLCENLCALCVKKMITLGARLKFSHSLDSDRVHLPPI